MTGQLATLDRPQRSEALGAPLAGVSIVLPCFEEEGNVAAAVRAASAAGRRAAPRAAAVVLTVALFAMWAPADVPALAHLGWLPPHTPVAHANSVSMHRLLR